MTKINNREWQRLQKLKLNSHISLKNDSRVRCLEAGKNKYLYENEIHAKTALRFNRENGAVRYYVCGTCYAYHLTSKKQHY